ncbi:hypothetical protein GCM10010909_31560 [Acidocella aquatica]|uniref:DUF5666 domain-containing protein n=1 Tax=Acidocella aquatica TaxID=1922313 RepID=A0ABQ6AAN9_9PROT|nr:DUF5666 domain-containing protein [Acidocella aquatica]GLR68475.1 hypothetical protein GCM10010909_31560 [Acidocella aquatica]
MNVLPQTRIKASRCAGMFPLGLALALLWACAVVLPAPARAQTSETGGIGGTGISAGTGGIGGTGISAGTGGIGGTGIARSGMPVTGYGPIQAFGSVFVNGREYAIDGRTLVMIDGAPATVSALRVGDIANVRGVITTARGGYAREIAIVHPIIGQVTDIAPDGASATVLGQHVVAPPGQTPFAGITPGALVAVSALPRPSGDWVAQRITRLPPGNHFQLAAVVTSLAPGRLAVAGTSILAQPSLTARLSAGERVIVSGSLSAQGLRADTALPAPVALGQPGGVVEVRGYFQTNAKGQLVTADGLLASGAPAGLHLNGQNLVEIQGELTAADSISIDLIDTEMLDAEDWTGAPASRAGPAVATPQRGEEPAEDLQKPETGVKPASQKPDASDVNRAPETGPEHTVPEVETPDIEAPDVETPEIESPSKD